MKSWAEYGDDQEAAESAKNKLTTPLAGWTRKDGSWSNAANLEHEALMPTFALNRCPAPPFWWMEKFQLHQYYFQEDPIPGRGAWMKHTVNKRGLEGGQKSQYGDGLESSAAAQADFIKNNWIAVKKPRLGVAAGLRWRL